MDDTKAQAQLAMANQLIEDIADAIMELKLDRGSLPVVTAIVDAVAPLVRVHERRRIALEHGVYNNGCSCCKTKYLYEVLGFTEDEWEALFEQGEEHPHEQPR